MWGKLHGAGWVCSIFCFSCVRPPLTSFCLYLSSPFLFSTSQDLLDSDWASVRKVLEQADILVIKYSVTDKLAFQQVRNGYAPRLRPLLRHWGVPVILVAVGARLNGGDAFCSVVFVRARVSLVLPTAPWQLMGPLCDCFTWNNGSLSGSKCKMPRLSASALDILLFYGSFRLISGQHHVLRVGPVRSLSGPLCPLVCPPSDEEDAHD